jgi:TonB family protein
MFVPAAREVLSQKAIAVKRLQLVLALFLLSSSPAAAIEVCSVLNQIEVGATLRGPGVLVVLGSKADEEHFHSCFFARISQAGSLDESLKRFQSEAPPTLAVSIADNLGSAGFGFLKSEPETTDTEVPGIGDRAVYRRSPKSERLFVASGSSFLILGLTGEKVGEKHKEDLADLAREAIATNFNGYLVLRYPVADRALVNDKAVFEADPKNYALLLFNMYRLDEARTYNLRAAAEPNDADVLYLQGVLDWTAAYQLRMRAKSRLGLTPLQPLTTGPGCAEVRSANRANVEEGIADLSKAIKLRPGFDAAMAYLNLLYRERADYQCDDAAARAADLKSADEWIDKTFATQKASAGNPSNVGTQLLFPAPPAPPPPPTSTPGGSVGGVLGGIIGNVPVAVPKTATLQRVQVSQGVSQGLLVHQVAPDYPALARQARIQGTVVLKAIINKDGSIESLTLVSGHPMLAPAAIDAVKQWHYKPYFLNGEPVEVETTINVNFTLAGG